MPYCYIHIYVVLYITILEARAMKPFKSLLEAKLEIGISVIPC